VTERRQAEIEREASLARTEAARRSAEAASRAKDEFLATVSHELRTPLTPILAWADLLHEGGLGADGTSQALAVIQRSARTQARLIDDLLDMSRIVAGEWEVTRRPVDLRGVLVAALDVVGPAAAAKGVTLGHELGDGPVEVAGDADRLQQVVWNLLSNAVKFTPRGGLVTVALRREDDGARVIVRDTGEGIDAEILPLIFDRFRQADTGASRRFGGLGLGLSIAKNLVELHGGTLTASSEGRGRGAELVVTLPVTTSVQETARETPAQPALRPLADTSLLVVEDDDATRVMLDVALRNFGASVTTAASAAEAMKVVDSRHFDLVVSDIGLPGEDGCTMLERMRRTRAGLRAIAVTAYASPSERDRALAAGFERWIPKPIDPVALAEEIRRLLSS
ncbi:MAG TPA: ATP-binding protein, partial [Thermoanaerobaculia bacterium]